MKDWKQQFRKHFLIERVTKIEVSDETEQTYVARPVDLKGAEATQALEQFFEALIEEAQEEGWTKATNAITKAMGDGYKALRKTTNENI